MVVSNIFYFHPCLRRWSNLINIFQMGWNHQLVMCFKCFIKVTYWHYTMPLTFPQNVTPTRPRWRVVTYGSSSFIWITPMKWMKWQSKLEVFPVATRWIVSWWMSRRDFDEFDEFDVVASVDGLMGGVFCWSSKKKVNLLLKKKPSVWRSRSPNLNVDIFVYKLYTPFKSMFFFLRNFRCGSFLRVGIWNHGPRWPHWKVGCNEMLFSAELHGFWGEFQKKRRSTFFYVV